jgi:hypothetical protein
VVWEVDVDVYRAWVGVRICIRLTGGREVTASRNLEDEAIILGICTLPIELAMVYEFSRICISNF